MERPLSNKAAIAPKNIWIRFECMMCFQVCNVEIKLDAIPAPPPAPCPRRMRF